MNEREPTSARTSHGAAIVSITGAPTQTVRIEGEVDLANTFEITQRVSQAHAPDVEHVVVDLTDTTYLDSAGLAMLVRISTRLAAARTPMTVVAPPGSAAHRVIALSGLMDELGLRADGPLL